MSGKPIQIADRWVGGSNPTYFIADISANHDGQLSRAKDLIFLAAEAGADAAKFQNFRAAPDRQRRWLPLTRRSEVPPGEVGQAGLRGLPGGLDPIRMDA